MRAMTVAVRTHPLAALAVLVLAFATAACVPVADPGRVEVQQFSGTPSFFPQETGLRWSYLPDGARLDEARYLITVEGPTVLDGDVWILFRLVGGGQDAGFYRQFRDDGVYLRRQTRPGGSFTFDPPIRELPAAGELRVGAIWSGSTTVEGVFPGASRPEGRRFTQRVDYVYTVVDRRTVTVGERPYEVFVIDFTTRSFDEDGAVAEELTQTLWFGPNVGTVRHENGWFLIETNFTAAAETP
jgi:hypothetical protein